MGLRDDGTGVTCTDQGGCLNEREVQEVEGQLQAIEEEGDAAI